VKGNLLLLAIYRNEQLWKQKPAVQECDATTAS